MGDYNDRKNRGRQHLRNKTKYKDTTKVAASKNAIKKSLQSNWDRYEDKEAEISEQILGNGSDFSVLENAPISKGSHFQFKTDATSEYLLQNAVLDTSNLFNLDLNMLGLSLASIPFYERCNIPACIFTESQKFVMEKTAKSNSALYHQTELVREKKNDYLISGQKTENTLNETKPQEDNKLEDLSFESLCIDTTDAPISDKYVEFTFRNQDNCGRSDVSSRIEQLENIEEDLDKELLVKEPSSSGFKKDANSKLEAKEKGPPQESGSSILETESLQAWLDDILGD